MASCQSITTDPHYAGGANPELYCDLPEGHGGEHTDNGEYDVVDWDDEGDVWVNGTRI